jgi:4-diphosphocytidyl-2-C-methyl-D-erythritol kinase
MRLEGFSRWPAPAKLNLFLSVTGRRGDGYRTLQTVFQLLDFGDEIFLRPRDDGDIVRVAGDETIAPDDDLAIRAARLLQRETGAEYGCDIAIDKHVPIGGGLGGGSSDAATVLVALDAIWGTRVGTARLAELGLALGADVPVFVHGRSAFAEGIGERLTALSLPQRWYLVVHPGVTVATGAVFQDPDLTRNSAPTTISRFLAGDLPRNDLEPVVCARHPEVAAALQWLRTLSGAARLTGSGACVFAPLPDEAAARAAAAMCPAPWRAIVARGVDESPLRVLAGKVGDGSRRGGPVG